MDLYQDECPSPIGLVYLISDGEAIRSVDFEGYEERMSRLLARHYDRYSLHPATGSNSKFSEARARLADYFAGDLGAISGLPVATNGTAFQRTVWAALRTIPAGTTISYGTLARRIGQPGASRAVGLANGSNPVALIVPCHRVIGANSKLTGYGGGIERKRWLLEHEGVKLVPSLPFPAEA